MLADNFTFVFAAGFLIALALLAGALLILSRKSHSDESEDHLSV